MSDLPAIPIIDAREGGPLATARLAARQMQALLDDASRLIPPPVFAITDRVSRRWLSRAQNPYLDEIDSIAAIAGRGGAHTLNTSFEWGCTSGVGNDPGGGIRLLRVLDWRQSGLGRAVIVAWQRGPAGDYANITWPGFVGVVTAMAPGRFAVALNQAPRPYRGLLLPIGWLAGRVAVWRSSALPAAHLLRWVCETCATYDDAFAVLSGTPLVGPALFTLAGINPGEGCVIERTQDQVAVRGMPAAVANHWVDLALPGKPRGVASQERQARLEAALNGAAKWIGPPIVNRDTRVVAMMNPVRGLIELQGWEKEGPVTAPLTLGST
jgi:hypothetical protein